MINVISTGSILISQSPSSPYIGSNTGNSVVGQMRYHSGRVEVYDGSSWLPISSNVYINLTPDAEDAIKWVMKKKAEEYQLIELAAKYPAIKDLREKLDVVIALVKEEEKI